MRGLPSLSEPLLSSVIHQQRLTSTCPLSFSIVKYRKLGCSNNRNLLFIVLEAESQRPGCQHGQVQVKALWLADSCFLALSHGREKERK